MPAPSFARAASRVGALVTAVAVLLLAAGVPAVARAQTTTSSTTGAKALVYCPVGVDTAGCDQIVKTLTGTAAFPGGVDRAYDGTSGTVDLAYVALSQYAVLVVPSLADDSTHAPYAVLRAAAVQAHLKAGVTGRVAVWGGTPDLGDANRTSKDQLLKNLASWGATDWSVAGTTGLVVLADLSADAAHRYDWLAGVSRLQLTADPELYGFDAATPKTGTGQQLLKSGSSTTTYLAYANMASFGLVLPASAAVGAVDAVGTADSSGTTVTRTLLVTAPGGGNTGAATIKTDKADYAVGEVVTFSGSGWTAGETVTITLHENPTIHDDDVLTAVADASGNIVNTQYSPEDTDDGMTYYVTARGGTSGLIAQTSFTDGNKVTFSLTATGSEITAFPGLTPNQCQAAFVQERQGSNLDPAPSGGRAVTMSSTPVGAEFHASSNCGGPGVSAVTIPAGQTNVGFSFRIPTAGSYTVSGNGGFGGGNNASATVSVAAPATTTTLASSANPSTYGTSVTFTATVTATGGNPTGVGTVTFSDGATTLCAAVALSGNAATCTVSTLNATSHSITAAYSGTAQFGASTSAALSQVVNPKALTATGITAANKVYDGTTTAALSFAGASLAGVVGSDAVSLNTASAVGAFSDKNVGTGKVVTITGLALTGAAAGNYTLNGPITTTASITAKSITAAVTANDKQYDGTTAATFALSPLSGLVAGDAVSVTAAAANFDTKAVGTGKTVTVTGLALSGAAAGNYTLSSTTATTTANITPKQLTGSFTAQSRVYDGTTTATVLTRSLTGTIGTDVVSLTGGTAAFADKNVGTGKTVTLVGATLAGTDAGNYTLAAAPITATADITAAPVTGSFTASSKQYDGTTAATIATRSLAGTIGTDNVTLTGGTATFASKVVGTGKTVTGTGFTLGGSDAANYALASGTLTTTADITAKALTGSFTASSKPYDGTTTAAVATTALPGVVGTDAVTLNVTGAQFATAAVGTGKTVTASLALAGADAGNYTVNTTATATADITPLTVTASFTAADKEYDRTTAATITGRSVTGAIAGETLTLTGGTATFADAKAGTSKTVTGTGFVLGGSTAANYTLASSTLTTTADITPKTVTATFAAADKVYDGNNGATITDRNLAGVIAGDVVNLGGGGATFDTRNVGTNKTVTGTSFALTGMDKDNYTLASTTLTTTADITPRSVTGAFTASSKIYDGTTDATVLTRSVSGTVGTDNVSLSGGTAGFDTKNVGTNKTVTLAGASLAGTDAGNYALDGGAITAKADITARSVTGSITAQNKVYDGTTAATVAASVAGAISGDAVSVTASSATFASKTIGTSKTVTATLALTGTDAGNYALNTTTATTTADITAKALTATITAQNKVYDGNTTATVTPALGAGVVGGDVVTAAVGAANFDDKHAGTGKTVTASLSLAGADAPNYTVNGTATATANITPKPLAATATAQSKIYDGTTTATASAAVATPSDVVGGDAVTVSVISATFDTKNVGTGKTVTVGVALGGADHGDYALSSSTVATTADITAKSVTGTFAAADKIYDANTVATITGRSLNGAIGGDAVSLTGGTASFDTKNVGAGKTVTGTGLVLSGTDAGNYALASSTLTTTASITPATAIGSFTAGDKTYDATTAATVTARNVSGTLGSDDLSLSGGTAAFADKNVGGGKTVTLTGAALAGTDAGNYTLAPGALTTTASITPASLTITASTPNSAEYGSPIPAVTPSFAGFVGGETATTGALTTQPTCGTTYTVGSDVDSYPTSCSGASAANGNYNIAYTAGTFAVTPATGVFSALLAPAITFGDGSAIVSGKLLSKFGALPATGQISVTIGAMGGALTGTATLDNTGAFSATINTTGLHANLTGYPVAIAYAATKNFQAASDNNLKLVVNKANQTITFAALAGKTYGDAPFSVSGTASSGLPLTFTVGATDKCTISGSTVTIIGAGSCTVTAAQAGNDDYNAATNVPRTFSIAKATPVITWATPAPVPQGTALSATQLNATAAGVGGTSLSGTFTYTPAAGTTVVDVGATTLNTTFNPADASNYNSQTASVQLTVTNVAPVVTLVSLTGTPVPVGTVVPVTATFTDPGTNDVHTATIGWDDGSSSPATVNEGARTVTGSHSFTAAGVYTITVTVSDNNGGTGSRVSSLETIGYVVVYDPSAGFVTGGGWINSPTGACKLSSCTDNTTGKANFGFNARYQKGANTPDGSTEFQFQAGGLNFKSTNYQWLVVAGTKAQYKGTGTVNGASGYSFLLTAIDGDSKGNPDAFRMKITNASGVVVYDNQMGSLDDSDNATTLGGGSIVIHQ